MANEAVILLKDIQGEKGVHSSVTEPSTKSVPVCRGELLLGTTIPARDGRLNYHLARDPSITLYCTEDDVAPLSDYDYKLVIAVKTRESRYGLFQKDILDWGSNLKEGDLVYVALPSKCPAPSQHVVAVIRYIGPLPNEEGVQFGVEIQVLP